MIDPSPLHFVAPDSTYWAVHEIRDDDHGSVRSLIFVSEAGFRRVRSYPANWRDLSPAELWALSWHR